VNIAAIISFQPSAFSFQQVVSRPMSRPAIRSARAKRVGKCPNPKKLRAESRARLQAGRSVLKAADRREAACSYDARRPYSGETRARTSTGSHTSRREPPSSLTAALSPASEM
jgi:hypothetical protein